MKILVINFEYPPLGGGGAIATRDIAETLGKRHQVHVLTTWYHTLPLTETRNSVMIHRVRVLGRRALPTASLLSLLTFIPAGLVKGLKLIRQHRFDVINAQFVLPSGIVGLMVARIARRPFVLSFIGGDVYDPTKGTSPHRHFLLRALVRMIARAATARTAISKDTKERARVLHGVKQPITVTPLGIRLDNAPAPLSRSSAELPEGVPIGISIGRLIPRKGFKQLIEAWRSVPGILLIIGSGPLKHDLEQLIVQYNLSDRVRLLGFVGEVRKQQLLRLADVYICAAEHEGFGIVLLEAMAAGLPIVATSSGGQLDFLINKENALFVPPRDPAALSRAIKRFGEDGALRESLASHNLKKVQEYSLDKTVQRFEHVLLGAVHPL